MSVKVTSNNTYDDPKYKFLDSIENISNDTMYLTGLSIQMYDKNNKLIDFTGLQEEQTLVPGDKILYKAFAPTVDNEDFDHYVVSAVGSNSSGYKTTTNDNNNYPKDTYDECVSVAGKSLCDFLFKK